MAHETKELIVRMNCVDVEQINLDMRIEQAEALIQTKEIKVKATPIKKSLFKLFKKAELNAKYTEQVIPIQQFERQRIYRDYGLR